MTQVFFPEVSELVEASSPHPPNTQYRVSIGVEKWEGTFVPVVKVQMVYDGVVAGRRSPSFPIGTNDLNRVMKTIEELSKSRGVL